MTDCGRRFDEELITGYLDDALTQGDRQRVEIHLERCASCRALYDDMAAIRGAARSTRIRVPDEGWREAPRGPASRSFRTVGWVMLIAWVVGLAAFSLWHLAISPEPLWEKVVVLGGIAGGGLLLLSVVLDRVHDLKTDRYRRVQK